MKNILVPIDFSACANDALDFALSIAKKNNATIHLLHIVKTSIDWVKMPKNKEDGFPEIKKQIIEAKNNLDELEKKIKSLNINADIPTI